MQINSQRSLELFQISNFAFFLTFNRQSMRQNWTRKKKKSYKVKLVVYLKTIKGTFTKKVCVSFQVVIRGGGGSTELADSRKTAKKISR